MVVESCGQDMDKWYAAVKGLFPDADLRVCRPYKQTYSAELRIGAETFEQSLVGFSQAVIEVCSDVLRAHGRL